MADAEAFPRQTHNISAQSDREAKLVDWERREAYTKRPLSSNWTQNYKFVFWAKMQRKPNSEALIRRPRVDPIFRAETRARISPQFPRTVFRDFFPRFDKIGTSRSLLIRWYINNFILKFCFNINNDNTTNKKMHV